MTQRATKIHGNPSVVGQDGILRGDCQSPLVGRTGVPTLIVGLSAFLLFLPFTACRAPHPPVDSALASCIPSDTVALAGANLDQLRASPLYQKLPPALLQPLHDASYLLLAYNGKDILAVARGAFHNPPPGAVLLAKDLAVSGSPDAIRAATAQHNTGRTGAAWLLDRAPSAAPLWVVALGGMAYPLPGDAANLNRFLSFADYASLSIHLDSGVRIDALGAARNPDSAQRLEESLRALFTLARAPKGIQLQRDGLNIRVTIAVTMDQLLAIYSQLP